MTGNAHRGKAKGKKRPEFVEDQAVDFGGMCKEKVGDDNEEEDNHGMYSVVGAFVDDAHMDAAAPAQVKVIKKLQ
jgi:hypothetical protein